MKNRIVVVTELYAPEQTSTAHYLSRIAEGLAASFAVEVFCAQPTYALRGTRAPRSEVLNGVMVTRCRSTVLDRSTVLFRLVNVLTMSVSFLLVGLRRIRRASFVLVVTNPPVLPPLLAAVCLLKRSALVLLIHDMYPEVLSLSGLMSERNLLYRAFNLISIWTLKKAARIVTLGRDMARRVGGKLGAEGDGKVVTITHWADLDEITALDRPGNELLSRLGLEGKFVVQYSGNMGRTHDLGVIVRAALALVDVPDVHFLLIGSGAKKRWLESEVEAGGLTNVTVLSPRERKDLAISLNACDLSLLTFVPGMTGVSVPSRMYNVMGAGKPIVAVADGDSELALTVREGDIGWVVRAGDARGLVEAVLDARADRERLASMGRRARALAVDRFSRSAAMTRYLEFFRELAR